MHRGSTSLHSNFTWTGSSPSTILGFTRLETLGYPMVMTSAFPRFDTMLECDGQTDGYAVAYTALQAVRCKNSESVTRNKLFRLLLLCYINMIHVLR